MTNPAVRSVKAQRAATAAQLRTEGATWPEVAGVFADRYGVNARVGLRLVHGWSQQDAADRWNERWPEEPKTFKNFSYWEQWPSSTGYEPSLEVLARLAELYECGVADLVADVADFRDRDLMHRTRTATATLTTALTPTPTGGADVDRDQARVEALAEFAHQLDTADVRDLAAMAAAWVRRLDPDGDSNALLFKLSYALNLAAAQTPVAETVPVGTRQRQARRTRTRDAQPPRLGLVMQA